MSSIVVAGDTSGSITLQAPAVSGSTILTLPASTGTVLTQNSSAPANSLVVDASGNVGIGSIPFNGSTTFNIGKSPVFVDGGYYGGGAYYDGGWKNTTDSQGGWVLRNSGGIFTVWTGASPGVAGSTFGTFNEKLRIDSSGNVGIGTSSPGYLLESKNTNGNPQFAVNDNTGISTIQQSNSLYINAGQSGTGSSTIFRYGTSRLESMRIDASGNLLVGTTTSSGKLTVNGGIYCSSGFVSDTILTDTTVI